MTGVGIDAVTEMVDSASTWLDFSDALIVSITGCGMSWKTW